MCNIFVLACVGPLLNHGHTRYQVSPQMFSNFVTYFPQQLKRSVFPLRAKYVELGSRKAFEHCNYPVAITGYVLLAI